MVFTQKAYNNKLTLVETQIAIKIVKDTFEKKLSENLNLIRVSAPLFVDPITGLNDNLNGIEKPVSFNLTKYDKKVEIVQSLAKWKRNALKEYGFTNGFGLYTDMNAIRPDEEIDNIHSVYVDQWDWERVISSNDRNIDFLKSIVILIVKSLSQTNDLLKKSFPILNFEVNEDVYFVDSQELLDLYPNMNPKERENEITKIKKTVFITRIGGKLSNGFPHDKRSPDYDDWNLNGDILIWSDALNMAVEISSMGIRVDDKSLMEQLILTNATDRLSLKYHKDIIESTLPLTIGGGIGQSRVCLLLLEKIHIGEVQSSYWPEEDKKLLEKMGAYIL